MICLRTRLLMCPLFLYLDTKNRPGCRASGPASCALVEVRAVEFKDSLNDFYSKQRTIRRLHKNRKNDSDSLGLDFWHFAALVMIVPEPPISVNGVPEAPTLRFSTKSRTSPPPARRSARSNRFHFQRRDVNLPRRVPSSSNGRSWSAVFLFWHFQSAASVSRTTLNVQPGYCVSSLETRESRT